MDTFLQAVLANAVLAGLLALAVGIVGRFLRRPEVVYWLWALVLLKLVTPPLIHVPILLSGMAPPSGVVSAQQVQPPGAVSVSSVLRPATTVAHGKSLSRVPSERFRPPSSPRAPMEIVATGGAGVASQRSEQPEPQSPALGEQSPAPRGNRLRRASSRRRSPPASPGVGFSWGYGWQAPCCGSPWPEFACCSSAG